MDLIIKKYTGESSSFIDKIFDFIKDLWDDFFKGKDSIKDPTKVDDNKNISNSTSEITNNTDVDNSTTNITNNTEINNTNVSNSTSNNTEIIDNTTNTDNSTSDVNNNTTIPDNNTSEDNTKKMILHLKIIVKILNLIIMLQTQIVVLMLVIV